MLKLWCLKLCEYDHISIAELVSEHVQGVLQLIHLFCVNKVAAETQKA
jgi:hypothetical protein